MTRLPGQGKRARNTRDTAIELFKDMERVEIIKLKIYTEAMEWKNTLIDSDDDSLVFFLEIREEVN